MKDTKFDEKRGFRLREERIRADLTQAEACELVGMSSKAAWIRYEKGQAFSLDVVDLLQARGLDMIYVVFGVRHKINEKQPEHELLQLFSQVSLDHRDGLMLLVRNYAQTYSQIQSPP